MTARINPSNLYDSLQYGFSHAALSPSGQMLHLAGQVAWDKNCEVVGVGDYAAQTRQAMANIKAVLEEAGCSPADVVRLRTYVVNHSVEKLPDVLGAIGEFYGDVVPAPNTFVGVAALAMPDFLVEIEAIASVPSE